MIPDETFWVRKTSRGNWSVFVVAGYTRRDDGHLYADWKHLFTELTEAEARQKLQWFVDRMKAYVVGT